MARPSFHGSLVERLRQIAAADIFYDPSFEDDPAEELAWEQTLNEARATIEEAAELLKTRGCEQQ